MKKKTKLSTGKILKKIKRRKLFDYSYETPGSIPGTLNISQDAIFPPIDLIDYNSEQAKMMLNV